MVAAAAGVCAGFDDVSAADPLCDSVEWLRNRAISLGCDSATFCPAQVVSRLSMAAFMNRLGSVIAPEVVNHYRTFSEVFVSDYFFPHGICGAEIPVADHARLAQVDATLSAIPDRTSAFRLRIDGLQEGPETIVYADAGRWFSTRLGATIEIAAGEPHGVGLAGLLHDGPPSTLAGQCRIRVQLFNRNPTFAPFDSMP